MKNFFNDHLFRVNTFTHLVPQVVTMGSSMLTKCVTNSEAINEILDLFRFIVDKYSGMTIAMPESADQAHPQGQTVNDFLISMLQQVWSRFVSVISNQNNSATEINFEEAYGEESIVLHSVVRVLNQIIVRVKLQDVNEESGWSVMNTSITIS